MNSKIPVAKPLVILHGDEMAQIATIDKGCRLIKGQVFTWQGSAGWQDLWDLDGTITK